MRIEHKQIKEQLEKIHDKIQKEDTKNDVDEERVRIFDQINNMPEESYKKCCSHG